MRPPHRLGAALAALLALAAPCSAGPVLNGGFESGLAGWTAIGDVSAVTSAIGSGPTQGSMQALLTTASLDSDDNTFSGTDAALAAALRAFLGLSAGDLPAAFEGSALRQSFTANAGDVVTFDYNFLTTEAGGQNDFAFFLLSPPAPLADADTSPLGPSGVDLDPAFGSATREAGYRSFSRTLPTTGSYTLSFGVVDAGDGFQPSALLVDNVQVGPTNGVVPGPGGLVLAGVAAACFSAFGLRRRRR